MQQRGQKKTQKLHLNVMTRCFADIPLFHLSNCTTIFHSLVSILSSNLTGMSVYLHCKNVKHAGRLAHIDTKISPKRCPFGPKNLLHHRSRCWLKNNLRVLWENIISLMHNGTFVMHRVKNRRFDVNM